jgi:hypothetical protein
MDAFAFCRQRNRSQLQYVAAVMPHSTGATFPLSLRASGASTLIEHQ